MKSNTFCLIGLVSQFACKLTFDLRTLLHCLQTETPQNILMINNSYKISPQFNKLIMVDILADIWQL